ncbi:MAG: hypothetical protein HY819_17270 [Acidobacteria bacterium]|nr:hypothetical protein [Acidobacteriota bacterium]
MKNYLNSFLELNNLNVPNNFFQHSEVKELSKLTEPKKVEKKTELILYCEQCSYRLNLPDSIKRGVCLSCYEKKHGRTTPPLETLDFQLEVTALAGSNPLTSKLQGTDMKLTDFLKKHDNPATSYTKIEKNSNTTVRLLTLEPKYCLPIWFDKDGKRRRLNSIGMNSNGEDTNLKCPIIALSEDTSRPTAVYGVYNFGTNRVELFCISQLSILRGLQALDQSLNAKNKQVTSYNLIISRTDTSGKTTYNISFAADHDLSQEDRQIISNAMDKDKPGNLFELISFETRWPTQNEINNLGLKIVLPDLPEIQAEGEDTAPF